MLDYCKTVNFNRNTGQQQQTLLEKVLEETEEIDGDACLAVVQKSVKAQDSESDIN